VLDQSTTGFDPTRTDGLYLWYRRGKTARSYLTPLEGTLTAKPVERAKRFRAEAQVRTNELSPVVGDLKKQGYLLRAIAAELTKRPVGTPRGGAWHPQLVARVLWEAMHVNRAHSACDNRPASRRHAGRMRDAACRHWQSRNWPRPVLASRGRLRATYEPPTRARIPPRRRG
jgi:hypothetical protein